MKKKNCKSFGKATRDVLFNGISIKKNTQVEIVDTRGSIYDILHDGVCTSVGYNYINKI